MSTINPGPIGPATAVKRGTMSAADKAKLDGYPDTPSTGAVSSVTQTNGLTLTAGDLTLTQAPVTLDAASSSWLTLVGQALKLTLVAASGATAGIVDDLAKTWNGVKTFAAEAVFSAGLVATGVRAIGAALLLRSDLGATSGDVCMRIGTSVADGTVNATAKLASFGTGIGGAYVESLFVLKNGRLGGGSAFVLLNDGTGAQIGYGANAFTTYGSTTVDTGATGRVQMRSTNVGDDQVKLFSASNGPGTRCVVLGTSISSPVAGAVLAAFTSNTSSGPVAHAIVTAAGEFETNIAGGGVVLKSPDGTRWRLTISNAGAVVVAAA